MPKDTLDLSLSDTPITVRTRTKGELERFYVLAPSCSWSDSFAARILPALEDEPRWQTEFRIDSMILRSPLSDKEIKRTMPEGYALTDPHQVLRVLRTLATRRWSNKSERLLERRSDRSVVPNLFHLCLGEKAEDNLTVAVWQVHYKGRKHDGWEWYFDALVHANPRYPAGSQLFYVVA